jgi:hypothetical protein
MERNKNSARCVTSFVGRGFNRDKKVSEKKRLQPLK